MKLLNTVLVVAMSAGIFYSCTTSSKEEQKTSQTESEEITDQGPRIVSLHASASEIISALGCEEDLVGTDITSVYPESVKKITKLGHISGITAQGILSLKPTLVVVHKDELSAQLEKQLQEVGVQIEKIEQNYTPEGTIRLISSLGETLDRKEEAQELIAAFNQEMDSLTVTSSNKKVVFIYARGAGTLMVAGKGTPMDALIQLAGAENPCSDFKDFKPLTSESLVKANPDVLFFFNSGIESMGGLESLSQIPGYNLINAGKEGHVVSMEGSLVSSFGPRLPKAIRELSNKLSAVQ